MSKQCLIKSKADSCFPPATMAGDRGRDATSDGSGVDSEAPAALRPERENPCRESSGDWRRRTGKRGKGNEGTALAAASREASAGKARRLPHGRGPHERLAPPAPSLAASGIPRPIRSLDRSDASPVAMHHGLGTALVLRMRVWQWNIGCGASADCRCCRPASAQIRWRLRRPKRRLVRLYGGPPALDEPHCACWGATFPSWQNSSAICQTQQHLLWCVHHLSVIPSGL